MVKSGKDHINIQTYAQNSETEEALSEIGQIWNRTKKKSKLCLQNLIVHKKGQSFVIKESNKSRHKRRTQKK